MATLTVTITPDVNNGTLAYVHGEFTGGSSSYKGQRRLGISANGMNTVYVLSPETGGGENTFDCEIEGLTPSTSYNWTSSLYYANTSGTWIDTGAQYRKTGSFTTQSGTEFPQKYTKFEYIESTGTQYIDTGFAATNNTRIVMDCLPKAINTNGSFPFAARTGLVKAFAAAVLSGAVFYNYADYYSSESMNVIGKRLTIDANRASCKFAISNSAATVSLATGSFTTDHPVYLMALNDGGKLYDGTQWIGLVYSVKWYESDVLQHEFTPCKNSRGAVGMWDSVRQKFYSNSGTGSFAVGAKPSLPSGYTRLEYVSATGTQYIDTDIVPNERTLINITYQNPSATSGVCIIGSDTTWKSNGFAIYSHLGEFSSSFLTYTLSSSKQNVILGNGKLIVNGDYIGTMSGVVSSGRSLYMFANNRGDGIREFLTGNIYECKIYDDGTLVRDFVPCKDLSGVVGMWDNVNQHFYANAGSGIFAAGDVVVAHRVLMDGTSYEIKNGKCLVDGTAYDILGGKTLMNGTSYDVKVNVNGSIPAGQMWIFTANQAWEVPATGNYQVELHGGGGSGGISANTYYLGDSSTLRGFYGGGGGGSGQRSTIALQKGVSIPITIGSGGSATSTTDGGASSFGTYLSVSGGKAGAWNTSSGGVGGAAAGNIATKGEDGGWASEYSNPVKNASGGLGNGENSAQTYGNGGRGSSYASSSLYPATDGQPGACIITFLGR